VLIIARAISFLLCFQGGFVRPDHISSSRQHYLKVDSYKYDYNYDHTVKYDHNVNAGHINGLAAKL